MSRPEVTVAEENLEAYPLGETPDDGYALGERDPHTGALRLLVAGTIVNRVKGYGTGNPVVEQLYVDDDGYMVPYDPKNIPDEVARLQYDLAQLEQI